MFQSLLPFIATALGVTRLSLSGTVIIDVESEISEMSNAGVMGAEELPATSHVPYMNIAVRVRKRGSSNTIARSPKKRHLNTAIAPAIAVVKEKAVLDVTHTVESSYLSPEAVHAQEVLLQVMKTGFYVYTKVFRNLHETHEIQSGGYLCESVDLFLCDPSYNI